MNALLWKDYRANRIVLVFGLTLLLLPYAAFLVLSIRHGLQRAQVAAELSPVALMSLGASLITIAALAGNAIAGERQDRSAEFLAYLPPTRRRIIASKAAVALSAALIIWLFNLAVVWVLVPWVRPADNPELGGAGDVSIALPVVAALAVVMFGAAWLGSAMLGTPTISTALGFCAPALVAGALQALQYYAAWYFDFSWWFRTVCITLGGVCFVVGVAYYLRRIEP